MPDSPIRALRAVEAVTAKVVHHAIGRAGIVQRLQECGYGTPHFCGGIYPWPS
jgi:hypothetical protein